MGLRREVRVLDSQETFMNYDGLDDLFDKYAVPAADWAYENLPPLIAWALCGVGAVLAMPIVIAWYLLVPPRWYK
jgi:hypothetical protein